ncbi:jg17827 [Pararge aegeria aegeria]|uniref:Jg17827 protein n=1 Tax=Pararge aegeria aegeria TaxID=348720 RepID=A0A8S4SGZ8_9NEOP|nr:jg17827 [Pararge aegeria aegeria]
MCSPGTKMFIHTKVYCNGKVCYIQYQEPRELDLLERALALRRNYSKQHGRPEENRRKKALDSESDSDSDTECKGFDRSEFWRRKMRTVHNILDVDKDGLISFNDFLLLSERFKALGHLDDEQAKEFTAIIKAVDKDKSGFISVNEFKLFFQCLGLSNEHAAVAFAVIDTNGVSFKSYTARQVNVWRMAKWNWLAY